MSSFSKLKKVYYSLHNVQCSSIISGAAFWPKRSQGDVQQIKFANRSYESELKRSTELAFQYFPLQFGYYTKLDFTQLESY